MALHLIVTKGGGGERRKGEEEEEVEEDLGGRSDGREDYSLTLMSSGICKRRREFGCNYIKNN